eukprot:ANDGO_00010.mRNA.1 hypothetical protein
MESKIDEERQAADPLLCPSPPASASSPISSASVNSSSPAYSTAADDEREPPFGFLFAFVSTTNSLFGTGVFFVAWVFQECGTFASGLWFLIQGLLFGISMLLLAESLARAEALEQVRSILTSGGMLRSGNVRCSLGDEVHGVAYVCKVFCGMHVVALWNLFSFAIAGAKMLLFGCVWMASFPQVSNTRWVAHSDVYALLALALSITILLSIGISLQLRGQVFLATCATLAFIGMLIAMVASVDSTEFEGSFEWIHAKKIGKLASFSALAFTNHQHASSLTRTLKNKDSITRLYAFAFFVVGLLYVFFGVLFSRLFGNSIEMMLPDNVPTHTGTVSLAVRYCLQIMCLLNILSSFPFQATTAGNVLLECMPSEMAKKCSRRLVRVFCSLLFIGVVYVIRDLTSALEWVGIGCIVFVLILTPLIHLRTANVSANVLGGTRKHPYAGPFAKPAFVYFMCLFGVVSLVFNIPPLYQALPA